MTQSRDGVSEDPINRKEQDTSRIRCAESEGRIKIYTNRSVAQESHEMVIFSEENNFQIVKDICIDKEIPYKNKILVENCNLRHNSIYCPLIEETDDGVASKLNRSKRSLFLEQYDSENLMKEAEVDMDAKNDTGVGKLMQIEESDTNHSCSLSKGDKEGQHFNKGLVKEASECDSSKEDMEELLETTICETKNKPGLEDEMLQGSKVLTQGPVIEHEHKNLIFSAVGPVSGRIAYSGPVAYSGSVSLRSNSSTASSRSFAFPILSTDWNSSPVRMVKAERKGKYRSWRRRLLCCKF